MIKGMPAEAAGFKAGDKILQLNGEPVSDLEGLSNRVMQGKAGDTLTFKVDREGKELELKAVLGEAKSITDTENGVGENDDVAHGKLSKRRTNLPLAIQHDGTVWADQCGGPLINLQGQTIGINIARYDRVCTFRSRPIWSRKPSPECGWLRRMRPPPNPPTWQPIPTTTKARL